MPVPGGGTYVPWVSSPAFSPDGTRLAFGYDILGLANSDGTEAPTIPGPVRGSGPAWSPNGRELVFEREAGPTTESDGLSIVGVDGQGGRVLTARAGDSQPSFSSRGQIAFVRDDDLYVINANGTGLRRLTRSRAFIESSPDFSPDGRRLVFSSGRAVLTGRAGYEPDGPDIFTMSARGGPARRLLRSPSDDGAPVWSPQGREIAFFFRRARVGGIGLVAANGRGYRTLVASGFDFVAGDFSSITWQPRPR